VTAVEGEVGGSYAPVSSFGWLDYDDRDAARMREMLGAFDDRDTVDSLGVGVIRDSFAEQLFPGTSTIQTRARYFLFVAWAYQQLEAQQVPSSQFAAQLRTSELRLIDALLAGGVGANQGMFGYVARHNVQRLPSVVYWNGLARFGIRLTDHSIAEHRSRLDWVHRRRRSVERDEEGQVVSLVEQTWDPGLPPPLPGFPDAPTNFDMRQVEADYLVERITMTCAGTLLATLVRDPSLAVDRSAPWEVDQEAVTPATKAVLRHGQNFSEVILGAQWLYNLLLAEKAQALNEAQASSVAEDMEIALAEWASIVARRRSELNQWADNLDPFWEQVGRAGRVPVATKAFVHRWVQAALEHAEDIAEDQEIRLLIVNRERDLKGRLARLTQLRPLENWSGGAFGGRLTYRWGNVQRLMVDIAAAGDD